MQSPGTKGGIAYRPDVDGLRAIAVLAVVGFHASPGRVSGGFVGVDIFFVISGFLISSIIFQRLERGAFIYTDFYARRIKRIFPALTVVLVACLVYGWFNLFPDEFSLLGKHAAGGAGFVYNLMAWWETGYFDPVSETKPLLHLWSLGIEEQYYIVWPLCLAALFAKTRNLHVFLWTVILSSFALNAALVNRYPDFVFYWPITRVWELGMGSLLAYYTRPGMRSKWIGVLHRSRWSRRITAIREVIAWLGLALLAGAFVLINKHSSFPGWWALLPTTGTFLLIAAGPRTLIARRLLANQYMVYVGLISYPLYLWHWPLFSFAEIAALGSGPSRELKLGLILLSFVLAALTYELVERPLRFRCTAARRTAVFATLMLGVCVAGLLIRAGNVPSSYSPAQTAYLEHFGSSTSAYQYITKYADAYRDECNFYDVEKNDGRPEIAPDCYTPDNDRSVLLWGDSHAQQQHAGLEAMLPPGVSLLQVATSGCSPLAEDRELAGYQHCNRSNRFALEVARQHKPQLVILAQARHHEKTDWLHIVDLLHSYGVEEVILLGPVPHWSPALYKVIAAQYWANTPKRIDTHLENDVFVTDAALKKAYAVAIPGFTYVSLLETLCNADGCLARLGDRRAEIFTWDTAHITPQAARHVATHILAPLAQLRIVFEKPMFEIASIESEYLSQR